MAAEAHTYIEKNHGAVERSDIMGPRVISLYQKDHSSMVNCYRATRITQ